MADVLRGFMAILFQNIVNLSNPVFMISSGVFGGFVSRNYNPPCHTHFRKTHRNGDSRLDSTAGVKKYSETNLVHTSSLNAQSYNAFVKSKPNQSWSITRNATTPRLDPMC